MGMKRFPRLLNLNEVGAKILAVAGILGLVIPAGAFAVSLLLSALGFSWEPYPLMRFFGLAGGIVGAGLLVMVVIELVQDHLVYLDFLKHQTQRLPISESYSECPYCGNRQVLKVETTCRVCGHTLN
jgi:hypothetical protein